MIYKSLFKFKCFPYLVILTAWAISFAAKLHTHGLMYGLDFGLYHPDGTLYTFRTLTWIGKTQAEAGLEISQWYASHASKFTNVDPNSLHFENNAMWDIYKLRLLYPLLSVPFVMLFGITGMLAIPALSLLALMVFVFEVSKYYNKTVLGVLLALFFSVSSTVSRWMYINTPDALLTAFFALVVFILVNRSKFRYVGTILVSLVLLTSFTRFALLIWISLGIVFIIDKYRKIGIAIIITAFLAFSPTLFANFAPSILASESSLPISKKIVHFPFSSLKVAFYEIAQLVVLDRYLIVFLIISTLIAISTIKSDSSKFYFAGLISLWLTGAINGVVGVNFRYQLPLLPFAAWVIIESIELLILRTRNYFTPKFR
jgi:hypothetical protein